MCADVSVNVLPVQEDAKTKLAEELSKIKVADMPVNSKEHVQALRSRQHGVVDKMLPVEAFKKHVSLRSNKNEGHSSASVVVLSCITGVRLVQINLDCGINDS